MAKSTDVDEEQPEIDPRELIVSGKVIRFILKKCRYRWQDLARVAKEHQDANGGMLCTKPKSLWEYMANTRQIGDVYLIITEKLVGKELYNKWLTVAYRDRPEWFSEPSAKQR